MALKSRMLNFKKIKLKKGENMIRSEKKTGKAVPYAHIVPGLSEKHAQS